MSKKERRRIKRLKKQEEPNIIGAVGYVTRNQKRRRYQVSPSKEFESHAKSSKASSSYESKGKGGTPVIDTNRNGSSNEFAVRRDKVAVSRDSSEFRRRRAPSKFVPFNATFKKGKRKFKSELLRAERAALHNAAA